ALSAAPDLRALLHALRRRWFAAFAIGGTLAVVAGLAAWFLLAPKYTAFAMLRVNSNIPELYGSRGKGTGPTDFATYLPPRATLVKSRPVLHNALKGAEVKRLNLEARETDPALFFEDELKCGFQDSSEFVPGLRSGVSPAEVTTIVRAITKAYMDLIVY